MLYAILAIIVICALCSVMNNNSRNARALEDAKNAQAKADADARYMMRVELFQRFLKEEMPELADSFTFPVAQAVWDRGQGANNDKYVKDRRNFFSKKPKSPEADDEIGKYLFQQAFAQFPRKLQEDIKKIEEGGAKVGRAYDSALKSRL